MFPNLDLLAGGLWPCVSKEPENLHCSELSRSHGNAPQNPCQTRHLLQKSPCGFFLSAPTKRKVSLYIYCSLNWFQVLPTYFFISSQHYLHNPLYGICRGLIRAGCSFGSHLPYTSRKISFMWEIEMQMQFLGTWMKNWIFQISKTWQKWFHKVAI